MHRSPSRSLPRSAQRGRSSACWPRWVGARIFHSRPAQQPPASRQRFHRLGFSRSADQLLEPFHAASPLGRGSALAEVCAKPSSVPVGENLTPRSRQKAEVRRQTPAERTDDGGSTKHLLLTSSSRQNGSRSTQPGPCFA